jgi:crotonobetainyl-CoA:carnitine CoA-transferase CaiB-like acyl-CoA transferase
MGAEVTRLASDDASASPRTGPIALALAALADGKQQLPVPASAAEFVGTLDGCDILLVDAPDALRAIGVDVRALDAQAAGLVVGVATTFGLDGPYAEFRGTQLDAQALSAVAWSLGEPGRAPLSLPPGILEHQAGAMLAPGCLVALQARDAPGAGRVVDIALSDVLASFVAGNCRLYIHHGLQWTRSGRRASGSGGAYPYVILPCKDGEVCICGRTRDEWKRFVGAMGNPAWAAEPRYQSLRAMGTQYPEEVDALVLPWLKEHTMAELEAIALANNLIVSPLREFDEILATPQFAARGFFDDFAIDGRTLRSPGLPFKATASRSESAPDFAAHLLAGRSKRPAPRNAAAPSAAVHGDAKPAQPLAGIRVLDFGWVWSAPWVGTILGELGAEVIKVEHALRPDNLRLAGRVLRDGKVVEGPTTEMSPMFHQVNHGKLGITLNSKSPRAVELLKQLAAMSDIVIENMSPGSLERSGLGYERLSAVNPKLVMLAMSAAGQFGPQSNMRAYAPTMSSFVGMESLVGYRGEEPIGALNFGLGDPNASAHGLVAVLAALRRARATGEGCYIDVSQVEALLSTLRPYLLASQMDRRQPQPLGNAHPDMAPHGIYPAAESDAWLTLAVTADAQWAALREVATAVTNSGDNSSWTSDPRFATRAGRLAERDALDAAIAAWTRTQPRDALVARLRSAGIASSPVLSVEEQWHDPQYVAREVKSRVTIPVYGDEDLFRAPWRFSDFAARIERCGPTLGEHNDHVFGELLGLPADEIAALKESGVIA